MTQDERHEFLCFLFEFDDELLPAEIGKGTRDLVRRNLRYRTATFYPCVRCSADTRYRDGDGNPYCGGDHR
jgi:hypothetical protein